jgi:hypothetical protein
MIMGFPDLLFALIYALLWVLLALGFFGFVRLAGWACVRLAERDRERRLAKDGAVWLAWLDEHELGPDAAEPDYGSRL